MQSFSCPNCGVRAYFHNLTCVCGQNLYFDPDSGQMHNYAVDCANRTNISCNWIAGPAGGFCGSCAMSHAVPDLNIGENLQLLAKAEHAKRWVLANLARWGWFSSGDPALRPMFRMLSEKVEGRTEQIIMGHANGEITINVTEADALIRLQRQRQMGEHYRSMIGHFRHELAHFCFDRLAVLPGFLPAFRELFGDETADYGAALERHYSFPLLAGQEFITSYATAHPHEDWAETVAHLLHLVDFTDSFINAGLSMASMPVNFAPYQEDDTGRLLAVAADVAVAVNDINRALDIDDLYSFVLSPKVREKLGFAHYWMKNHLTLA